MKDACARHRARSLTGSVALLTLSYPLLLRKRCLNWGATHEERNRSMPGDDLLPSAELVSTRAVTIYAPPSAIWPWLVQMGPGRGGAYTYDWIENLFGLGMHSADTILPEFQHPLVGDAQRLGKKGLVMRMAVIAPEHFLVLRSDDGAWVWEFGLYPDGEATRLVSRNHLAPPHPTPASKLFDLYIMEPGSLIMERKMLLGIKQRAEALVRDQAEEAPQMAAAGSGGGQSA